jgi:SAM-dependent methyltransferase
VTREIAARLATVSKSLEAKHKPEQVAMFLMRCLFTMFAEDVGLLPEASFKEVLQRCEKEPATFVHDVGQLWEAMDKGGYAHAIRRTVKRFNGEFFKNPEVLSLSAEAICELRLAASHNWKEVEPAIFGTLVEQALNPEERKKLGAHYTPRAYVERLVHATIIDPLRQEWRDIGTAVETFRGEQAKAIKLVQGFHDRLCDLRILDPACGTGNFLYVALELLKRLEGEVLEVLANLGGQEALTGLSGHTVDPHQFLGLELNPRAAAIAELVLWIGYLQWFFRTSKGEPEEPILKAFHNITVQDAVLTPDRTKRPEWPEADYIIGNPPFIGGSLIRTRLGDEYAQALWKVHKSLGMNESADFVMYWWDRAAELLTREGTRLKRFGLVTTNSISQVFQRRVMERHLNAKKPVSLLMAIADHPWTKATKDSAAVRIAMTVAAAGKHEGRLYEVVREEGLDTDSPTITLSERQGVIHSDLTIGVDVTRAGPLKANEAICSPGVKLHGAGFIVTPAHATALGLGSVPGLEKHIRHYRNGRDLTSRPRGVMVIDLFGLEAEEVRKRFPAVYQHVLAEVKPERDANNRASYKDNWWIFGEPRKDLRPALANLPRYIATVETTKHRVFQFLDESILPDNKLIVFAIDDAFRLGVLMSRVHWHWYIANSAKIGMYESDAVYVKSRCFDPFPFPEASEKQQAAIRALAEELDAHRKRVLAAHPHLTLTGLYNVLERVRAGALKPDLFTPAPASLPDLDSRKSVPAGEVLPLTADERRIFEDGLVLILKELHDNLDIAVAEAYGWPADLAEEEILARLVALNAERAKEEARGNVKWLRPDYQIPRFGSAKEKAQLEAELVGGRAGTAEVIPLGPKPSFPEHDIERVFAVMDVLRKADRALSPAEVAMHFKQGRRIERIVVDVLEAALRMANAERDGAGYAIKQAA